MEKEKRQTTRQAIIFVLEQGPATVRDISQSVGIPEKDVYHHLPHIQKSIRNNNRQIFLEPYKCLACGYRFTKRKTFKRPGKCPGCRNERIEPAEYWISEE